MNVIKSARNNVFFFFFSSHQDAVCIAELWRVLHSIAFQLDYVMSLNKALQDLIQAAIDNPQLVTPLLKLEKGKVIRPAKVIIAY